MDKKFQKLFLIIFFLFSCTSTNADNDLVVEQKDSEDVLIEIMEGYRNFSSDPDKAVEIIWNNAHIDNKEVTGPIERFKSMLISAPYNAIVDLTEYSYEVIQEDAFQRLSLYQACCCECLCLRMCWSFLVVLLRHAIDKAPL